MEIVGLQTNSYLEPVNVLYFGEQPSKTRSKFQSKQVVYIYTYLMVFAPPFQDAIVLVAKEALGTLASKKKGLKQSKEYQISSDFPPKIEETLGFICPEKKCVSCLLWKILDFRRCSWTNFSKLLLMVQKSGQPVEVGDLSRYWQGFSTIPGG